MTAVVEAVRGDITLETCDAIVNAARSSLLGGGGVDGAVHAAGGRTILDECRELRGSFLPDGLPTGDAVATGAGQMPSTWVIHTVGPKHWEHSDGGADMLARCHERALTVADELGATSVAFPAISCGAYGWSPAMAAPIAVGAVRRYLTAHPASSIALVRFVLSSDETLRVFEAALEVPSPDS